jgi:hypothetical protein
MVRRLAKMLISRALQGPDDWEKVLEDTLLSMGCGLTSVDSNHKLRMMQAAPLEAASLRQERDYWREDAFKNACEADKAERRAKLWKRCAQKFRDKHNAWWDGVGDMFPDEPKRASRRAS